MVTSNERKRLLDDISNLEEFCPFWFSPILGSTKDLAQKTENENCFAGMREFIDRILKVGFQALEVNSANMLHAPATRAQAQEYDDEFDDV